MNVVQQLRNCGFKVRVTHFRRYLDDGLCSYLYEAYSRETILKNADENKILRDLVTYYAPRHEGPGLQYALPRGGYTQVILEKDGIFYSECSYCSPKDQFNKKLGTKIALNRILYHCPHIREEVLSSTTV